MWAVERENLQELIVGRKKIIGVEVVGDDELLITMLVNGREITLRGQPEIDAAPTFVRPWEDDPNWLNKNYAEHGSFAAISRAYSLTDNAAGTMQAYAKDRLHWRIQDGNEMKRWQFIELHFASPVPSKRPPAEQIAKQLDISKGNVSRWRTEALAGRFFSKYFTLERLLELQNYRRTHYVYFPDAEFSPDDFSLAQKDGWPTLPAGLLSELLPRLKGWETHGIQETSQGHRVKLIHTGKAIEFELVGVETRRGSVADAGQLNAIETLEDRDGILRFSFDAARIDGQVAQVHEARATPHYDLR